MSNFSFAQIAVGKKDVTLSYDNQTGLISWNGEITTALEKAALYQKIKNFTGSRYHPESSEKVTDDATNGIIEIRCQFDEVHKILGSMTVAPTGAVYYTLRLQISGSVVRYSFTNFYHRVDARHLRTVLPSFGYLEDFDTPEERETLSKYYQQNYKDDLAAIISQAEAHVTIEIAKLNQYLTK